MRSAHRLFRFQLGVAALGAVALASAVVATANVTALAAPGADELARACWAVIPEPLSAASIAVLALALLSGASAVRATASAAQHILMHRRLLRTLRTSEPTVIGGVRIEVFASARPEAFCAGLCDPRIFVSSAATRLLSRDELIAVVAHEHYHAQRRDPLRLLLIRVLRDALFFLPVLRDAERRYAALAEVAADEAAIARGGSAALASALLQFEAQSGGAVSITAERVDHLMGEPARWRLRASLLAGGALALVGLVALITTLTATGSRGEFSAPMLAMQLCSVSMIVVPAAAAALLARAAWRAVKR